MSVDKKHLESRIKLLEGTIKELEQVPILNENPKNAKDMLPQLYSIAEYATESDKPKLIHTIGIFENKLFYTNSRLLHPTEVFPETNRGFGDIEDIKINKIIFYKNINNYK